MRIGSALLRWSLGLGLILHGLANAVMPLRGADIAAPGLAMPLLTGLYVVSIVGFVAAGLGVLGVRPLKRASIPLVLVAGVCALVAQFLDKSADLWVGVTLSATLPILTTLHETMTIDLPISRTRWHLVADLAGLAFLAWVATAAVVWPWSRGWGTEPSEWTLALPGDHVPRTPALEILHAVTIDAPPSAVWPWLVQLGQDRAGFYSYDWLERLFGVQIRNAEEIHPEWQTRQAGDRVYATQAGYLGGLFGERPGWVVNTVEPDHALVLNQWGAFVLLPAPNGGTRMLIRSTISHPRIPAWAAALNVTAFELPHFIMQRRMLLGIKALAERSAERVEASS